MSHAGYNRDVGVVDIPDAAFVPGQVLRATDTANAAFRGGTNHGLQIGNAAGGYQETIVEQCAPLANPPTFLWLNASTNDFECVAYTHVTAQGPAGAVQRSDGAGALVGDAMLSYDGAAASLGLGDATNNALPGKLSFRLNASSTTPAQIDGRGGGQFWRLYANRSMGWSMESGFIGLDSQNDSTTDALSLGKNNSDPLLATNVFRWGEDGTERFYGSSGGGDYVSFQAPSSGNTGRYTWPAAAPLTTRYCLGSDLTGAFSWVDCALLLGRSGGQILLGGTVSGEHLTLGSNSADTNTGAIKTISFLQVRPDTMTWSTAATRNIMAWPGQVDINSSQAFFKILATGDAIVNYNAMPLFGLGPTLFGAQMAINFNATGSWSGMPAFAHNPTYTIATGTTTTLGSSGANASGSFHDVPVWARAGTGALDASADYLAFKSSGSIGTGLTMDDWTSFRGFNIAGAGTLNQRHVVLIDNQTNCTAPNCSGLSNSSTTDYPGATQALSASAEITGCKTRTSAYLTNSTAAAITVAATPTLANGRDGQVCRITDVETTAGAGAQIILQDEGTLAGTNLRMPAATGNCTLCGFGVCTLDARDFVEFTFNSTLGDWIMTGCSDN